MRWRGFGTGVMVIAGVILLAGARGRAGAGRRPNPVLQREAAALSAGAGQLQKEVQSVQDELNKAQEEYNAAKKEMSAIRKESDDAEKAVRDAGRALSEIAEKIENSQLEDSPFGQARAKYLEAKEAYDKSLARAESSPQLRAAKQEAELAADRAEALREARRKWIDQDPAVAEALSKYQSSRSPYEIRRDQTLHNNEEWQRASKALADARKSRDEAARGAKGNAAAKREAGAKKQIAKLRSQLEAKKAALARVEAAERRVPPGGKRKAAKR